MRVVFAGDEFTGFATHGPAEHIRVWVPFEGQDRPVMPEWGPEGPAMPAGVPRPNSRVYTPRRWFPERNELEVDFIVHGEGPGSAWAATAAPGSIVVISGPSGPYRPAPAGTWWLLACDEAGLPAAHTVLQSLPSGVPARLLVEVSSEAETAALDDTREAEVTWLLPNGNEAPGSLLEAAVREQSFPEGQARVWVACEADAMRRIRSHLLFDRRLDRDAIHTHGYWKAGAANHPDHDLGQEI